MVPEDLADLVRVYVMLIDLSVYVVGVDDTCDLSHATTTSTHSTQCRVPLPCHPLPPRHCHTIPSGCQRPLCEGRTPTHRASTPTLRSNMRRSNSPFVFVLVWLLLPALPCVEGICVVPTPWLLHICSQHITTPAVTWAWGAPPSAACEALDPADQTAA